MPVHVVAPASQKRHHARPGGEPRRQIEHRLALVDAHVEVRCSAGRELNESSTYLSASFMLSLPPRRNATMLVQHWHNQERHTVP